MKIPARMTKAGNEVPEFQVDECFAEEVMKHKWVLTGKGTNVYLSKTFYQPKKCIKLHRFIWELAGMSKPSYGLDHINGDVFDNRLENLRVATRSLNMLNTKQRKEMKLPQGIYQQPKGGGYTVRLHHKGIKHNLGTHRTSEEASSVYRDAKEILIEFAALPGYEDVING